MWLLGRLVLVNALQRRHYCRAPIVPGWKARINKSLPRPPTEADTLWDPRAPLEYLDQFPKPSENYNKILEAIPRNSTGSGYSRFQRMNGHVPGIVFDSKDNHLGGNKRIILLWQSTLKGLVDSIGRTFFLSRLFDLVVRPSFDSDEIIEKVRVLPKQIWFNLDLSVINITFIRAHPGTWVKVDVPFVFHGEDACPGMKQGIYLNIIHRKCPFLCPVEVIPPYIDVDVSNLKVGQILFFGNLKFHPALKLLKPVNQPFVKLGGSIRRKPKSLLQFIGKPLGNPKRSPHG